MANAIPVLWECSECQLEYEKEEDAVECCDTTDPGNVEPIEDENEEEIDETDDEDEDEVE